MDLLEAISARHSVRAYKETPLSKETVAILKEKIDVFNRDGNLHIQLVMNEPKAFQGTMAKYGNSVVLPTISLWLARKVTTLMNVLGIMVSIWSYWLRRLA